MTNQSSMPITAASIMTHNPIAIGIDTKLEEITGIFHFAQNLQSARHHRKWNSDWRAFGGRTC